MGDLTTPRFSFADAEGRTWRVVLTCRKVIEAGRYLGVKVLDLFDEGSEESKRLDSLARFDALVFVIEDELHRCGVTRADFERAMPKANYIAAAWQAFYAAVLRFLPADQRGAVRGTGKKSSAPVSLHDAAVEMIWHFAGWCGVEPWDYTLAELKQQARSTASREGRSSAVKAGSTPEVVRPLSDLSPEEKAELFRTRS